MIPEQRIQELKTRQVWYDSSIVIKLSKIDKVFCYSISAWVNESKILVKSGIYNNEDPNDLVQIGLFELQVRKIKLGVPIK